MGPPLGIEHDQKVILSVGKTLVPNGYSLTWSHWETCCTTTLYNVIVHLSSKDQLKWHIFRQPPSPLERTLSSADVGWPCIIYKQLHRLDFEPNLFSMKIFGWIVCFDYLDRKKLHYKQLHWLDSKLKLFQNTFNRAFPWMTYLDELFCFDYLDGKNILDPSSEG